MNAKRKFPQTKEQRNARRDKLFEALSRESERGLVLVSVAYMDEALESFLRARFNIREEKSKEVIEPLFHVTGPLSSFYGKVRQIVDGLRKRKLNIWFDKEHLGPGRWKQKIIKAINQSRFFVICISEAALRKTGADNNNVGFQDEELNIAYSIALDQPDSGFTIVPVRIEDCGRGDFRLSSFQQFNLFDDFEKGLDKLSVDLGGISLSDAAAKDDRTEDEKMIEGLMGKAVAANYVGDYNKAIKITDALLEIKPDYAEAWDNKGVALGYLNRHEEALKACEKAIELDPKDAKAWANKGVILIDLDRHEEALKAYEKAIELDPKLATAWYNKGTALTNLGRHEEALKACEKAIELDPKLAKAWYNKGTALTNLNRHEEALKVYENAIELDPKLAQAWFNRACVYSLKGDKDRSLSDLKKAIEIDLTCKEDAKKDDDFKALWNDENFKKLVG